MKKLLTLCLLLTACGGGGGWTNDQRDIFLRNCTDGNAYWGDVCLCVVDHVQESYSFDEWKKGKITETDIIRITHVCEDA